MPDSGRLCDNQSDHEGLRKVLPETRSAAVGVAAPAQDKRLFTAGPLMDFEWRTITPRAASAHDARDIMDHDPAIIARTFTGRLDHWRAAVDSGKTIAGILE
jgi:hypothetical protein